MVLQALAFYLFAAIIIASGIMVIAAKNPVHSVLFLILAFFNGAGLFVLVGAEFLAMIMVIVYVGAVAVLFMFVVMMLNINFVELRQGFLQYLPVGLLIGLILLVELVFVMTSQVGDPKSVAFSALPIPPLEEIENTKDIGIVLYTDYFYLFQISGLILLVAMIGSIVLTLRERSGVKKQSIQNQININASQAIEKKKIKINSGIDV